MTETAHRAGAVAILGRPNAGKSTLLNHLLGEKLAIVSAKPQTTRSRILGIVSRDNAQLLLYDTPGMHESTRSLNRALNDMVDQAAQGCDLAWLLVDPRSGWGDDHAQLVRRLESRSCPVLIVATKHDVANRDPTAIDAAVGEAVGGAVGGAKVWRISARTGAGVDALVAETAARLPESPPLFPEDQISDRPMRFLAAELIREAAFDLLSQELPYALAVEVVEYDESRSDLLRIRADLLVERTSQKQIVIGYPGQNIKRIGIRARHEIEKLTGRKVHLELWVKVEPKWSQRPKRLISLGYS